MKMLVTGKNGQLGQALLDLAAEQHINAVGHDRDTCDITQSAIVERVLDNEQPTVVINAAAFNLVPKCEETPENAFAINTFAVHTLARECKKRGIQFVTYSTDYVFDGTSSKPYTEDQHPHPLQMYGISKYAGELACLNANEQSVVIRTSSLYGGLSGSPAKGNFVLSILKQAASTAQLEVSNEQRMSPTYAVDLARATLDLLTTNGPVGLYHLVNEGECSWAEFAAKIIEIRQLPHKIIPVNRGGKTGDMKRPQYSVLSNTRAKAEGIVLPRWEDAIERYLSTFTLDRKS